jgi:uncharacterized membrane protein
VRAPDDAPADAGPADESGLAARRVSVAAVAGGAAGVVAILANASWPVAALCAVDVGMLVYIASVSIALGGADAVATARMARAEDSSRRAAERIILGTGAVSLIVVGFVLAEAGSAHAPARGLLAGLALASVGLAWTGLHVVYIARYARLYYSPPEGGIDFSGESPDFRDFAYLALTIGMTYQVSDTNLTGKRVRRIALHHALFSYVFGAAILAITVNIAAGLLGH